MDRSSKITLAVSLLLHALLIAPVWQELDLIPASVASAPVERAEPLTFQFVDPPEAPIEEPDAETRLVSTTDSRAAQPDPPSERPEGDAFQVGRTTLRSTPSTPVPPGSPPSGSPTTASDQPSPTAATESSAERSPVTDRGTRPAEPRLTPRQNPLGFRPAPPDRTGASQRLPVPEVDQRLTGARTSSTFSLNTMAWDYAPYLARLKAQIEQHIFPPAAFYFGTAAWATRVRFRIGPDGSLLVLAVIAHEGVNNLQYVAHDAIRTSADFEPLPPDFPETYLEITGNFYFNTFPPPMR